MAQILHLVVLFSDSAVMYVAVDWSDLPREMMHLFGELLSTSFVLMSKRVVRIWSGQMQSAFVRFLLLRGGCSAH